MGGSAFITFFDKAEGESIVKGRERNWIEVLDWNWSVEADTSWTKGGGASVGKPNPGGLTWTHQFDVASPVILGSICTGRAFPKAELQLTRETGSGAAETYLAMVMEGAFITRVAHSGSAEGDAVQQVEMVFKTVRIDYKRQDRATGQLGPAKTFTWDIAAGTASPSI